MDTQGRAVQNLVPGKARQAGRAKEAAEVWLLNFSLKGKESQPRRGGRAGNSRCFDTSSWNKTSSSRGESKYVGQETMGDSRTEKMPGCSQLKCFCFSSGREDDGYSYLKIFLNILYILCQEQMLALQPEKIYRAFLS